MSPRTVPAVEESHLPWDRVRLSVVVPVFNEVATVRRVVERVREVPLSVEVIAVDDASTDGSSDLLLELEQEGLLDRLLFHVRNRGKGAALRAGFREATGDVVVIQDADLEYDPHEFLALLEPILGGWADAVYGSRFLGGPRRAHLFWHAVGNRAVTFLSNVFTNLNLSDMETCYKMIRRDLLETLPLTRERFGIEPEITARLAQARARVYEVPISYRGRSYAEGKKIQWRDGAAAVWHIVRSHILSPRAPVWEPPAQDPWAEDSPRPDKGGGGGGAESSLPG